MGDIWSILIKWTSVNHHPIKEWEHYQELFYLSIPSLLQPQDPATLLPPIHCSSFQDNFKLICKAVKPVCTYKENEMSSSLSTSILALAIYRCLHFSNILGKRHLTVVSIFIFLMINEVKYISLGHMSFKFCEVYVVLVICCCLTTYHKLNSLK